MQNVSFSQIVDQLYKTFSNEAEASQYTNTQSGAQYMGLCGWAGVMSPLNRAAFLKEFGQDVTDRAEREARARVAEYRAAYEASEYHRHEMEADTFAASYGDPQKSQIPAVGSFVWCRCSNMKGDGDGVSDQLRHLEQMTSEGEDVARCLVEVRDVVTVAPCDFLNVKKADEIARTLPGCHRYEETDPQRLDGRPYTWAVGAVVCCGSRWFVVDSEGYDYARYYYLPDNFAEMYRADLLGFQKLREDREAARIAEEEAAKAARLAEYRARCAQWDGAGLVDVRLLIAAEEEANKAHGWRSAEAKSAARKLAAARRRNILTMCQAAAPGVKFSVRKWDGWGGSYEVSWTDGPTEAELKAAADLDLLEEGRDTFDGMTDCAGHTRAEFVDFAAQYLGVFGEINTSRETSPEYRAEIIARIREAVPGLPEDDRAPVDESTAWTIADTFTPDTLHRYDVAEYAQRWGLSDAAALIARNTSRPTTSETPTDPTPDNGGTGAAYGESEKSQNQEAPDGLTLEEITGGVAVVGDSRATYKARRDIKAHGARWNKAAQRWEATDPEAVESLRQWLTPAPVADATPTEEAAPVAYGEAEKSQPQSEADRARVRLEEIRASIEAEAVSYAEIAELQNELRPYIAPDDLQLLEWASPEEEAQELPAPPAAVVYDPAQPVERAQFHTIEEGDEYRAATAEGVAYGPAEKSQTRTPEAEAINAALVVVEGNIMRNLAFINDAGELVTNAGTAALLHPSRGFVVMPDDDGTPYTPLGGAEALREILQAGGFLNFEGFRFVWPVDFDAPAMARLMAAYGMPQKSPICEATEAAKELEAEMMAEAIAHHVRLKQQHPDALLLLRCGDFYELWLSDAEIGADVLRLTLTRRPDGVPICAFPYMALDTYLPKLVRAGHRVAICDDLRTKRRPIHQEATA